MHNKALTAHFNLCICAYDVQCISNKRKCKQLLLHKRLFSFSYPNNEPVPLSTDLALERAMFSCVLRPLKTHLDKALMALHSQDGSSQLLTQNMLRLKGDTTMERLGVRTGVPDSREVERVKQKLVLMQRTHSPIDKVLLLLQVCKCVHKAVGSLHGEAMSKNSFISFKFLAFTE